MNVEDVGALGEAICASNDLMQSGLEVGEDLCLTVGSVLAVESHTAGKLLGEEFSVCN